MATSGRSSVTASARARKLIPANSAARALVLIGDRWSLLIIGSAFCGLRRFDEWRKGLGIASNILSSRLSRLVRLGCFEKLRVDAGAHPCYRLTEMGRQLFPTALMFWRLDHLWSRQHPLQVNTLVHTTCGRQMTPDIVCGHCRVPVLARDVRFADGPGARMESMPPPRSSRRSGVTLDDGAAAHMLLGDSIDYFGDRWTQLVFASFFLGERRYEGIRARWHISTNILANRLRLLVDNGLLERRIYQTNPERSEYRLTPKGMDVYPIMLTLTRWGDRWLAGKRGPPLLLRHSRCGAELDATVVCDGCGGALHLHEVQFSMRDQRDRAGTP